MRVLIVNRHLLDTLGGSETQCDGIAQQLVRMGHEVTYAACRPKRYSYPAAYAVVRLDEPLVASFRRLLDRVRPDVIYWRYNKRNLLRCTVAAQRRRIKFILAVSHINDTRVVAAKPPMTNGLSFTRRAVRYGRWVRALALSAFNSLGYLLLSGVVLQHGGQDARALRGRRRVIYNSAYLVPAAATIAPPAGRYVLWVGSVKKSKNPEQYVALAEALRDLDVRFLMAGEIQDRDYAALIREAADRLPNFRYVGLQTQAGISALMAQSLMLVHTCSPEGFPNVFVQAWAQGKPVVSLHFDPDELLKSQHVGLHSGNWQAFVQDVKSLIEDEVARMGMGDRARALVHQRFDAHANVNSLAEFMRELGAPGRASEPTSTSGRN